MLTEEATDVTVVKLSVTTELDLGIIISGESTRFALLILELRKLITWFIIKNSYMEPIRRIFD